MALLVVLEGQWAHLAVQSLLVVGVQHRFDVRSMSHLTSLQLVHHSEGRRGWAHLMFLVGPPVVAHQSSSYHSFLLFGAAHPIIPTLHEVDHALLEPRAAIHS